VTKLLPTEQRWPRTSLVMAVALALCLPGLGGGFFTDDHVLMAEVEGRVPGVRPWDLYSFAPDGETLQRWIDLGAYPWWTSPEVRIRLFRPLPSLLVNAEHAVFGRRAPGYHLVTLAVFAAMLLVASRVLRAALPDAPAVAGVAFAVFAWNDIQAQPATWLADRHAPLAALFGFAGLWLHVRRREAGGSWGGPAAPALSAVALLCSEVGLQPLAYVLAYELLRRRKPAPGQGRAPGRSWASELIRRERLVPVLPAAALAVGYLATYRALGYGTRGSATYLDPGSDPLGFLAALPLRLPAFAADLLGGVSLDLWLLSPGVRPLLVGLGVASLAVFGWALWKTNAHEGPVGWLLAGALLAAIPATPGAPGGRLLLVPGLGVAAGLAALILRLPARSRRWGALAVVLAVVHLVLQPLEMLVQVVVMGQIARRTEIAAREVPVPRRPGVDVALVGVADPMIGLYVGMTRLLSEPRPRSWRSLTMAPCDHQLHPVGRDALEVTLVGCRMMNAEWERLFNAHPFQRGQVFQAAGLKAEALEVVDGGPTRLRFTFDRALDDPDLVLLTWRDGALRKVELPAGGSGH